MFKAQATPFGVLKAQDITESKLKEEIAKGPKIFLDALKFNKSYENATKQGYKGDSTTFAKQLTQEGYAIEGYSEYQKEQIKQQYIKSLHDKQKETIEQAKKNTEKKSFLETIKSFAEGRAENVEKVYERTGKGEQTLLEAPLQMAGEGIGFVGDVIGAGMIEGAKGLYNMLPNFVQEGLEEKAKEIIKKPSVQEGLYWVTQGANKYNKWADSHPRADANLRSVFNIGEMVLNFKAGKIVGETLQKGTKETLEAGAEVIGAAGKTAGYVGNKVGKGIDELTTGVLGLTTGTSPDTIKTALKTAGTPDFIAGLRGQIDNTDVLDTVNSAMQGLKQNRSQLYGEGYDILLNSAAKVDVQEVAQNFYNKVFGKGGFGVKAIDGALDFDTSTISRGSPQKNVIENIMADLTTWADNGDFSPASMDILKKRIGDYWQGTESFKQTDMLVTQLEKDIARGIIEQVPEYAVMNKKYMELSNIIRDVSGALSLGNNKQTTTAVTKLIGTLKRNQEFRQLMISELQKYSSKDIMGQLAGVALSESMPRGLAGVIAGGATIINPSFLAGLAIASPRIVGELANAVGIGVKTVKEAIENAKQLVPDFVKQSTTKAVKGAKEAGEYALSNPYTDVFPIDISTIFDSFGIQNTEGEEGKSIEEMMKNATDEELRSAGFTATMIKQRRKKNPLVK